MSNAPICIFVYKRRDTFEKVVESLLRNPECSVSSLYIFSDAAKGEKDRRAVEDVRNFARHIEGFASVTLVERPSNQGLAKSIISGVTEVLQTHGEIIVLEDDLVVSDNFLAYMNQCLDKYRTNSKIWSVSGYSSEKISALSCESDVFFGPRASSWGWATWMDRWQRVDWAVSDFHKLDDAKTRHDFNRGGSDLVTMLKRQRTGSIDSWAIRFCFYQFLNNALDVVPHYSKVINLGFEESATNTSGMEGRFYTELDSSGRRKFDLPDVVNRDKEFEEAFRAPFGIKVRLKYRLRGLFNGLLSRSISKIQQASLSGISQ